MAARGPGPVPGPVGAAGPGPDQGGHVHHHPGRGPSQRSDLAARRLGPEAVGRSASGPPGGGRRSVGLRGAERDLRRPLALPEHPPGRPLAPLRRPPAVGVRGSGRRPGPVRPGPGGPSGPAAGVGGHHRASWWPPPPTDWSRDDSRGGSTLALLFCLWLLVEHQHFRVKPTGVTRLFIWAAAVGLVVIAATAGIGNLVGDGPSRPLRCGLPAGRGGRLGRPAPGRRSPAVSPAGPGTAREEAFARARTIIETHGGRHARLLRPARRQVVVLHRGVAGGLLGDQRGDARLPRSHRPPAGPGRGVVRRHGHGPGQQLAALGAGRLAVVARRSTGPPGWSTTTSATRPSSMPPSSPSRASR